MKLSQRGEYALRALVVLGMHYRPGTAVIPIHEISKEQNIPKRFLEQILNDLKSAGILTSRRGVAGGYRLARSPDKINLAEVIRHIEGPLAPVGCVSEKFYEPCTCPDEARCSIRSVMADVRTGIVKVLESVTVAELCQRARKLQESAASPVEYSI